MDCPVDHLEADQLESFGTEHHITDPHVIQHRPDHRFIRIALTRLTQHTQAADLTVLHLAPITHQLPNEPRLRAKARDEMAAAAAKLHPDAHTRLLDIFTVFAYYAPMQREDWIAICAHELQRRWRTVDPAQLDDLAGDLWNDARLRELPPAQAATAWLAPIAREQIHLGK